MNWYVGQKVVCVDASGGLPLTQGKTYTIRAVMNNCQCGITLDVGVGLPLRDEQGVFFMLGCIVVCGGCRGEYILRSFGHDFKAYRFRPLDSLTEQLERIESEGAPVEQPEPKHA